VAFLVGTFDLPDCHSRPIWTEPLVVAMAERHQLAGRSGVMNRTGFAGGFNS